MTIASSNDPGRQELDQLSQIIDQALAGQTLTSMRETTSQNWHTHQHEQRDTGQRAADIMRNGMGSWRFVGLFLLFMACWALLNGHSGGWDPYPYILLNLFLSMLAGLQGAILLIAAKRQDAIAAALAQHDFETNVQAKADIELLLEINRRQLLILTTLREVQENRQV